MKLAEVHPDSSYLMPSAADASAPSPSSSFKKQSGSSKRGSLSVFRSKRGSVVSGDAPDADKDDSFSFSKRGSLFSSFRKSSVAGKRGSVADTESYPADRRGSSAADRRGSGVFSTILRNIGPDAGKRSSTVAPGAPEGPNADASDGSFTKAGSGERGGEVRVAGKRGSVTFGSKRGSITSSVTFGGSSSKRGSVTFGSSSKRGSVTGGSGGSRRNSLTKLLHVIARPDRRQSRRFTVTGKLMSEDMDDGSQTTDDAARPTKLRGSGKAASRSAYDLMCEEEDMLAANTRTDQEEDDEERRAHADLRAEIGRLMKDANEARKRVDEHQAELDRRYHASGTLIGGEISEQETISNLKREQNKYVACVTEVRQHRTAMNLKTRWIRKKRSESRVSAELKDAATSAAVAALDNAESSSSPGKVAESSSSPGKVRSPAAAAR